MTEQIPSRYTLDTYMLGDYSLRDWHHALTTDDKGKPTGGLACPVSRYGRTATDCAYWAIAAEVIYVDSNGLSEADDLAADIELAMGLVVNDHPDIAGLVRDYGYALPMALRKMLGETEQVRRVLYGA